MNMMEKVEPYCIVTVTYVMRTQLQDGTVNERPEEVTEFVYGVEYQVATIEKALDGARVGDRLGIQIPASEIYGEHAPSLIREIPKKGLVKQRLRQGQFYRQMKKGTLVSFKVLEVRPDTVLADFNRPMAGISIFMDLEVQAIRQATKEEIDAAYEAQLKRNIGCG